MIGNLKTTIYTDLPIFVIIFDARKRVRRLVRLARVRGCLITLKERLRCSKAERFEHAKRSYEDESLI